MASQSTRSDQTNPALGAALGYADGPAMRPALASADTKRQAVIIPASQRPASFIIPLSDKEQASRAIEALGANWAELSEHVGYKAAMEIPKSIAAGDIYLKQMNAAIEKFETVKRSIDLDFENGRRVYRIEYLERHLAARQALLKELTGKLLTGVPFRTIDVDDLASMASIKLIQKDLDLAQSMIGKPGITPKGQLKNAVVRAKDLVSTADDTLLIAEKNFATKLAKLSKALFILDLAPSVAAVLSATDATRHEKEMKLHAKVAGVLAGAITSAYLPVVVGLFLSATPAGWVVISVAIGAGVAGTFVGDGVEHMAKDFLILK